MSGKTINLDSRGDLLLEFASKQVSVCSRVLCLASPVFGKMLHGPFSEGQKLRQQQDQPAVIALDDVDEKAMDICLEVLHHKVQVTAPAPTPSCLEEIAFICDRFDCTAPMMGHGTVWLQRDLTALTDDDCCRLLLFAYTVHCAPSFQQLSNELTSRYSTRVNPWEYLKDHPLLRCQFQDDFKVLYERQEEQVRKILNAPTLTLLDYGCQAACLAVGQYQRMLYQHSILPIHEHYPRRSIREIQNQAKRLEPFVYRKDLCKRADCSCWSFNGRDHIDQIASKLSALRDQGLCLMCVQQQAPTASRHTCSTTSGDDGASDKKRRRRE